MALPFSLPVKGSRRATKPARRQRSDSYATPDAVARFMCRTALAEYLRGQQSGGAYDPAAVLSCRVCDPAAGDGALLLAMFAEKSAVVARQDVSRAEDATVKRQIGASLYGAEIQEAQAKRCRSHLAAKSGMDPDGVQERIVCGDSLLGRPFAGQPGFDIVVMNPPYVSFGLRGAGAARKPWADAVRHRYPRSAEYKLSTYAVFMDMGLSLTRPGGVLCCLTPDSFLLGRFFGKLRRRLLDDCAIRSLVLIDDDFWDGAVVGRPVISVFRVEKGTDERPVLTAARCPTTADLETGRWQACACPQADFEAQPRQRFRLLFSEEDRQFVAAVERGAGRLGDVISFASGLIGRAGRAAIVADRPRGPTWRPGIDTGADVLPYRVRRRGKYLNLAPPALKSGFREARYDEPKLLLRQTGDALVAAYDPDGLCCLNNVHVGNATGAGVDVRLMTAILNSDLMNRYYRLLSLEAGRPLAQVDIDVVEELPFKRPGAEEEREIIAFVSRLQGGLPPDEERHTRQRLEAHVCAAYLGAARTGFDKRRRP